MSAIPVKVQLLKIEAYTPVANPGGAEGAMAPPPQPCTNKS